VDSGSAGTGRLASTSGITVNSGGTLLLAQSGAASNDRINDSATMTLNANGSSTVAFNTGGLSEHGASNNTAGIGALTLSSTSIIDLGSAASIVAFADSHLSTWTGTLKIYNWTGTPYTGNGADELFFGNNNTTNALSSAQLADIVFYSDSGITQIGSATGQLSTGEVVPIPEPSTFVAASLLLGALGYRERRKIGAVLKKVSHGS
jgi:hypothetical protein